MILFEKDWNSYPTADANWDTTNRSFVRISALFRSMGIKNHTFMLALVNQELRGIDPFSPDLTFEQKVAIGVECKINPWFYFREIARAPARGGVDPEMVEANRGNMALWWLFFNHITVILIQIRQTGKSFCTDLLMIWLLMIGCQNTSINLLTKDDILRRANIERMKSIIDDLPQYLNLKRWDDAANTEEVTVKALGNTYKTHVPQASEKNAYKLGRGLTSQIFHVDEPPFQSNIEIALPSALAAAGAAVDSAKKAGTPWGTIFTTTAGKKDDRDGRYFYGVVCDAAIWDEVFYDSENEAELEKIVRRNSRTNEAMVNCTFNHRQLGKTDEWLKEKLEKSRAKGDDANRDYFNMWTSGSQSSPIPLHILEIMARNIKDVKHAEISKPYGYITRWYIPKDQIEKRMASGKYVLGMDTSEAAGRDEISLVVTDVETLEVVAAGSYNETNLITFSEWLGHFLVRFPNVIANLERRSTGGMILDHLIVILMRNGIDPFKRLFNWVVNDAGAEKERFKEATVPMQRRQQGWHEKYKRLFGFGTSGSGATSRTELYSTTLQNAAKLAGDRMNDKKLIDQTASLITKNGRVDHPDKEHDDMTIGWLMSMWVIMQGTNLVHYGIDPTKVMMRVKKEKVKTYEDIVRDEEQAFFRERVEELLERLSQEQDQWVSSRLELELRVMDSKLIVEDRETFSVDQLIRNAKETKRSNMGHKRLAKQGSAYGETSYAEAKQQSEHGYFSDDPWSLSGNIAARYRGR